MKILAVDDSMMVRNSIKRMLKETAYQDAVYLTADNGKNGLELFEKEKPDILILDLLMPVIDGTEVVRQLQTVQHQCFIAILSSNFQKPVKERLIRMGAHLFVEKPITKEKLGTIFKTYENHQKG